MSARRAFWCVLFCSVMLIASARAQSLLVDVIPGFDGTCPGEGCYPVTVLILGQRTNAPPAVCEVVVTANTWNGSTTARKLVTLPGGLVSQAVGLLLCTPDEPYEITARLILRGRVLAVSKPAQAIMAQYYPLLVGLGVENSSLAHLPQRSLGVVSARGMLIPASLVPQSPPPYLTHGSSQNRRIFIGRTRNSLPPDSALAYRGVAAVSLDDRAWDTLTERQQQALKGYVLSGGLLVVHGVDINRLQSLMPSGLLSVEPKGLSQVPAYALAKWAPALSRSAAAVDVVRAHPLGGARTVLGYGEIPLVVTASKGLGQVVFLAFDPGQAPFTGEDVAYSLWKNLLALHQGRFVPPARVFPDNFASSWGISPLISETDFYADLLLAMVNAVAAKPVALNWLIAYLGVYILVLIPLNYVVLRRMDRLHLSWFTLPLLAVLTSAAGYLIASRVQASSPQRRQWTALYTTSGSPQAIVESDWVLYSAKTQRYRLQAKVEGTMLENSSTDLQARRVAETSQEEPADLRDVPIPLWSARSFHLSGRVNLPGTVSVSAERQGNVLRLRVRNGTPYTIRDLSLVTQSAIYAVGATCSPGSQIELEVSSRTKTFIPESPRIRYFSAKPSSAYPQPNPTTGSDWQQQAKDDWLGLIWSRLNSTTIIPPTNDTKPSDAVLVGKLEGFPEVVEITPQTATQHNTLLAVHFDTRGGNQW